MDYQYPNAYYGQASARFPLPLRGEGARMSRLYFHYANKIGYKMFLANRNAIIDGDTCSIMEEKHNGRSSCHQAGYSVAFTDDNCHIDEAGDIDDSNSKRRIIDPYTYADLKNLLEIRRDDSRALHMGTFADI